MQIYGDEEDVQRVQSAGAKHHDDQRNEQRHQHPVVSKEGQTLPELAQDVRGGSRCAFHDLHRRVDEQDSEE